MFDPGLIVAPTLLVVGEWDRTTPPYMASELEPLLDHAASRRRVEVPAGTHFLFLERNRDALFAAVRAFLDER